MTCKLPDSASVLVARFLREADLNEIGRCSVAEAYGVSWETLRRRLMAEGTSWSELKTRERTRRLVDILETTPRFNAVVVARGLGFQSTERFFTFFKSVMGQTYTEWRMARQEFV